MATTRRLLLLAVVLVAQASCLRPATARLAGARGAEAARLPSSRKATVREYRKVFRTYPFSDPNPIPVVGRIYPYFRFDG
jgi:hypothetical protein